jgi:peroxiredoxin Q/BCP
VEYVPGDPAPHFNLRDQEGRQILLFDYFDRTNVLVAFVPKDGPAATPLAAAIRSGAFRLREAGAETLVVVGAGAAEAKAFAAAQELSIPVLADDDRSVSREFGVESPSGEVEPAAFLIDRSGNIAAVYKAPDPSRLCEEVLAAVKA